MEMIDKTRQEVKFDADVEVDCLKDAVFRLTTRVYLLEDFIAEKFGEVLGPSGYSKSKDNVVRGEQEVNSSPSPIPARRSTRKRRRVKYTEMKEREHKEPREKIQKTFVTGGENDKNKRQNSGIQLIKDEVLSDSGHDVYLDTEHEFTGFDDLAQYGEEDEASRDDGEDDPDFIPENNNDDETDTPENIARAAKESEAVRFVESQRGKDKLEFSGFVYCLSRSVKDSSYWCCERRRRCKATAVYCKGKFLKITQDHNHEPEPARFEILNLLYKMRIEAETGTGAPSSIFKKVMEEASPEATANMSLELCRRNIINIRKRKTDPEHKETKRRRKPKPFVLLLSEKARKSGTDSTEAQTDQSEGEIPIQSTVLNNMG